MIFKCFALSFVLSGCLTAFSADTPQPINIKHAASGPKLDGNLDEEFWKDAPEVKDFYVLRSPKKTDDTIVKLGCDNKWLYLGITCKHPAPDKLRYKKVKHDGNVLASESLEIFIEPGTGGHIYCQFMVNCGNNRAERRISGGSRENQWNPPWRSVVKRLPDGWSVEIAIPLYALASEGKLDRMTINIGRNKHVLTGQRYKRSWSCMAPVKRSFHEFKKFVPVKGVVSTGTPFMPVVRNIGTSKWRLAKGRYLYEVSVALDNVSNKSGKVRLRITDIPETGGKRIFIKDVILNGKKQSTAIIPVPVPFPGPLKVKVEVIELGKNNTTIFTRILDNPSSLRVLTALPDRNYYTSEKQAITVCTSMLPEDTLNKLKVIVKNTHGEKLAESAKCSAKWEMEIPLTTLPLGENILTLTYRAGKISGTQKLLICKLSPNPNGEVKIDKINCRLLKNGKPFFPVYLTVYRETDRLLEQAKQAGFNTILVRQSRRKSDFFIANSKTASKNGLAMTTYLPGFAGKNFRTVYVQLNRGLSLKDVREFLTASMKFIESVVKIGKNTPPLLAYVISQPGHSLPGQDPMISGIIRKYDKYHPGIILFSRLLDATPKEMSYADVYAIDPFWGYSISNNNKVYHVAKLTVPAVKIARSDHKPLIVTPFASFWNGPAQKRFKPDQRIYKCMAFLAAINGAQGINLCYYHMKGTPDPWPGFLDAAKGIKPALPYLSSSEIAAKVSYSPVDYNPLQENFPPVMASLRENAKGECAILATNCLPVKSKVEFQLNELKKSKVKELCSSSEIAVSKGSFTDEIEPYGVRVYQLGILPNREAYNLKVNSLQK